MIRRAGLQFLVVLLIVFAASAAAASGKDYVLEDWDGPAPVKSWSANPSLDTNGWAPALSDPLTFSTWTGATWWAPKGLYATAKFALFAGPGTGEWHWKAPGSSTVYRAEYGPVITHTVGCVNEGMRTSTGAWQASVNGAPGWTAKTSAHPTGCTPGSWVPWTPSGQIFIGALGRQVFCSTTACSRLGSPTGNRAVFGVQRTRAVQPQFDAYLPGARLYLTDYDKPTVTAGTNSLSGWVNSGTGSVTATATDAGLGVKSVTITGPTPLTGSPATKTTTLSCTGDRNDRCPASWNTIKPNTTASLGYDVATLPEGINPFAASATDIVDNVSAANTTAIPPVKVDRTAPGTITTTGPLVEDEDHYFNGTDPQNVTVTATDPAAANGQQLSGVKIVRVEEVGGATLAKRTAVCADQCPATANETFSAPMAGLSEGTHQLRAVVTDLAGNTATGDTWNVIVDRTAATPSGLQLSDYEDAAYGATITWLESDDPALGDGTPGSGSAGWTVQVAVNGAARAPETTSDPLITIPEVPAGSRVLVTITAIDNVGNAGGQSQLDLNPIDNQDEDPALLEAMAQYHMAEYGRTHAEAVEWVTDKIKVDAAAGGNIDGALSDAVGSDRFGGAYFDNVNRRFTVRVTAASSVPGAQSVLSDAGVASQSTIVVGGSTSAHAISVLDRIVSRLESQGIFDITIAPKPAIGGLELTYADDLSASDRAKVLAVDTEDVAVDFVAVPGEAVRPQTMRCSWPDCDLPMRAGVANYYADNGPNAWCTQGFRAQKDGDVFWLSAGHCLKDLIITQGLNSNLHIRSPSGQLQRFAVVPQTWDANGGFFDERGDLGILRSRISSTRSWVFVPKDPQAPTTRDIRYAIRGLGSNSAAAKNHDGDDVCLVGRASGADCAEVLAVGQTLRLKDSFGERVKIGRLAKTNLCAAPGDSGGPVFKQHRAFGIASAAGAGDRRHRCFTYYTGALTAERELDVKIG